MSEGQKMTPAVLTGWVIVLASLSIYVAIKYQSAVAMTDRLDKDRQELEQKKIEMDEWEKDLVAREGEWRKDFEVTNSGLDAIPPPSEDKGPRHVVIPPKP